MRVVVVIVLLSTIATSISLYVINQKNKIIENQVAQQVESQKKIKTYQSIISSDKQISKQQIDKLNILNTQLKQVKDANKHLKYLGNFQITYYDLSYESCGKNPTDKGYGITYSGAKAKEGVTIAVDKNIIPLGSYVYVDKIGCRVAQDIGGKIKGNHIDVFVNDFSYDKYKINQSEVYLIE
jgi:3D (Asp-Asp-Asp) domain-containing protein